MRELPSKKNGVQLLANGTRIQLSAKWAFQLLVWTSPSISTFPIVICFELLFVPGTGSNAQQKLEHWSHNNPLHFFLDYTIQLFFLVISWAHVCIIRNEFSMPLLQFPFLTSYWTIPEEDNTRKQIEKRVKNNPFCWKEWK